MNKIVVAGISFGAAVLAVIVYSTMNLARYRVEVCIEFKGQSQCRTASADSEEHAFRAATANACALISSGVTDTIACQDARPTKVIWLKK